MVKFAYLVQTDETKKQLLSAQGTSREVIKELVEIGYDGIELLVRNPKKSNLKEIFKLRENGATEIVSIGTGPMVADDQLSLSATGNDVREEAVNRIKELIGWANEFETTINIGKIRGNIGDASPHKYWDFLRDSLSMILDEAAKKNVSILLEPQNKTQINTLNSTEETLEFIQEFKFTNLGIMLDLVHLESEPENNSDLINQAAEKLKYVHLADSQRTIPTKGDFEIENFIRTIDQIDSNMFLGLEIAQGDRQLKTAEEAFLELQNLNSQ